VIVEYDIALETRNGKLDFAPVIDDLGVFAKLLLPFAAFVGNGTVLVGAQSPKWVDGELWWSHTGVTYLER
jgi:hypothetical protein